MATPPVQYTSRFQTRWWTFQGQNPTRECDRRANTNRTAPAPLAGAKERTGLFPRLYHGAETGSVGRKLKLVRGGLTFGPLGDDGVLERGDGGRRRVLLGPDVGAVRQPELDLELLLHPGHLTQELGTRSPRQLQREEPPFQQEEPRERKEREENSN